MVLYDSNDYVEEIEEEEYNRTVIESDDVWIVEFYAPWCVWGRRGNTRELQSCTEVTTNSWVYASCSLKRECIIPS